MNEPRFTHLPFVEKDRKMKTCDDNILRVMEIWKRLPMGFSLTIWEYISLTLWERIFISSSLQFREKGQKHESISLHGMK